MLFTGVYCVAFVVHEFLFSVQLIKLCLQVKSGVYCLERLCDPAPFSLLALRLTSIYPSNDFYSPALLFFFHPCTAVFIFLQGQTHLSFSILFNVLTDLIEMTVKIYGIWSLCTLCFFFFLSLARWQRKIIYTWGIDTCWEWGTSKSLDVIYQNLKRNVLHNNLLESFTLLIFDLCTFGRILF